MARPQQIQQRFSCFVSKPSGPRYDITADVESATLEQDPNLIDVLTISITRNVNKYMDLFLKGFHVSFYGGFLDNSNYATLNKDEYEYSRAITEYFRFIFKGVVHSLSAMYPSDGAKSITLVCKEISASKTTISKDYFAYPSTACKRPFADANTNPTLKLSQIVKGIADYIGLSLPDENFFVTNDYEYTKRNPAVQNGISDWKFLCQLAKDHDCYVWTELVSNDYVLHFMQRQKVQDTPTKRYEFIYIDRDDENNLLAPKQVTDGDGKSELSRLKKNQLLLSDINFSLAQESIGGYVVAVIPDFTVSSGDKEEVLVSYVEEADKFIYFELDREKVRTLVRTDPTRADRLTSMGPTNIPREEFEEFYIKREISKDTLKAIDRPLLGVSIDASTTGNLDLQPYQSYAVYGLGRWSTRGNGYPKYYMQSLVHRWENGTFITSFTLKA